MPTAFDHRYIIVVRADLAPAANLAASQPDTDNGGTGHLTFSVPLSASGSAPAQAYWCNWALTTAQAGAIRNRLIERGASAAEVLPVPFPSGTPASNKFAVFDVAAGWDPESVLAKLGLQRSVPAGP
jgi:hypothetical protein